MVDRRVILPRNTSEDILAEFDERGVPYVLAECDCPRLPAGSLLLEHVCERGHRLTSTTR